ncbi:MAG: tyrosine-type recombinase/integrase [Candidatus Saliniplasma sp.]
MNKKRKVWLDKSELETLESCAYRQKDVCIVKLGAWVGLRVSEIVAAKVKDINEEIIDDESRYFLEVAGKKTNQQKGKGEKKHREALIPKKVYYDLVRLINEKRLKDDDPLIPNKNGEHMSTAGVRDIIYRIGERAHRRTNKEKFLHVSPHDLRRFFASYYLNEKRKNPRVVMKIGGWADFQGIKPYWGEPSKKTIVREMEK